MIEVMNRKLLQGKPVLGVRIELNCPEVARTCMEMGFQWLLVDAGPAAGATTATRLLADLGEALPAAVMVRVDAGDAHGIAAALDAGATGVVVHGVDTPARMTQAVRACLYPPAGHRRVGAAAAAGLTRASAQIRLGQMNAGIACIAEIDTAEAVRAVDRILAVDGVTGLLLDPLNLSVALGAPLDYAGTAFCSALSSVLAATIQAGKLAGVAATAKDLDPTVASRFVDMGFQLLLLGSDRELLRDAGDVLLRRFDDALAGNGNS